MTGDGPRTGPRHEPERIYERAADPAEAVDRTLEPKATADRLKSADEPGEHQRADPHHRLNTSVGRPKAEADSDPYRPLDAQDEDDRASGTTGSGQEGER